MKKLLVKILVGVVVVILVAVVGIFVFIDSIAKSAIEQGATYALGVPTTLGKADVGVFSGTFSMAGLDVHNPEGFEGDHFMTLGTGDVAVSLGTLRSDTVELPILRLSDIDLSLEKKGSSSNYQVIADNLKRFESKEGTGGETKPKGEAGKGKDFMIQEILITNINVTADVTPIGGKLNRVRVPIDEIRLENVGTGSGQSVSMGEVADIVIKAILAAVVANAADFPADLINDLGPQLEGLASLGDLGIEHTFSAAKDLGEGVGKAVEGLGKGGDDLGQGVDQAVKGLGGLLGGKKDR